MTVDERGVPLSPVGGGANGHDVKLLEPTRDQAAVAPPQP
jgi:hypothetical protein